MPNLYYCINTAATANKRYAVVALFDENTSDAYTFTVIPKVIDNQLWKANKQNSVNYTISNTVYLKSTATDYSKYSKVNYTIDHTVIDKKVDGYDATNHLIKWVVEFNKSQVNLPDAQITDTLENTQEFFIDGSHRVMLKVENQEANVLSPDASISKADTMEAGTHYSNTAKLDYTDTEYENPVSIPASLVATAQKELGMNFVSKEGIAQTGNNSIINWTVKLNENGFKMKAPHMTDTMPAGLYLDSSSLVVKEEVGAALTKDVDYEYSVAAMVDLSGQVYYRLSIDFKNDIEIPYIITYKTYVMADAANTTYSNHIELDGEDNTPLAGAVFEIVNESGTYSGEIITGEDGIATLENLPIGTYSVREIKAPLGYEIDDEDAETGSTLAGAKYSLSSPGQTTIYVTTGSDGTVTTNVALGIWEVTEINAPENYTLPDEHERTQYSSWKI